MGCYEIKDRKQNSDQTSKKQPEKPIKPSSEVMNKAFNDVYKQKPNQPSISKSHNPKFYLSGKPDKEKHNGNEHEISGEKINEEKLNNNVQNNYEIKISIERKEENEINNLLREQQEYEENKIKNSENINQISSIINSEKNEDNKGKMDINDIFEAQMKNSNLNIEETDIKKSNKESEKNVNIFESNDENNSITADNRNENFGEQKTRLVKDSIYNNNLFQNPSKILTTESIYKNNLSCQTIENQKNTQISNKLQSINTSIKPQLENNIGGIAKIPEEKEDKNSFDD